MKCFKSMHGFFPVTSEDPTEGLNVSVEPANIQARPTGQKNQNPSKSGRLAVSGLCQEQW